MNSQNKINKQLARELDTFRLLARKDEHAKKHPAMFNSFTQTLPEILVRELLALMKLESAIENAVKADEAAAVFADPALAAKIDKVKDIPSGLSDLLKTLPEHEREKFNIAQKYNSAAVSAARKVYEAQFDVQNVQKLRNEFILSPVRNSNGTFDLIDSVSFYANKLHAGWIPAGYGLAFAENSKSEFRLVAVKK